MGLYVMLSDWSKSKMQSVDDQELNELYREAYALDNTLLISEYKIQKPKKWFSKTKYENMYILYHECYNQEGKSMMEALQILSGSGTKEVTQAYLYGIINGKIR